MNAAQPTTRRRPERQQRRLGRCGGGGGNELGLPAFPVGAHFRTDTPPISGGTPSISGRSSPPISGRATSISGQTSPISGRTPPVSGPLLDPPPASPFLVPLLRTRFRSVPPIISGRNLPLYPTISPHFRSTHTAPPPHFRFLSPVPTREGRDFRRGGRGSHLHFRSRRGRKGAGQRRPAHHISTNQSVQQWETALSIINAIINCLH